jgi:hypothetical protein
MKNRLLIIVLVTGGLGLFGRLSLAQNAAPAPPPPPQVSKDKAAAETAAIQAPIITAPPSVSKLSAPRPAATGKLLTPANAPSGAGMKLPDVRVAPPNAGGTLKLNPPPADLRPPSTRNSPLPPVIEAPPTPPVIPRASPPPAPPEPPASMTKDQALEAVTKSGQMGIEAPRIATPSDKIPIVSSTSASGQFRVHGNELALRSRMSSHLDEIAGELRAALKDGEAHVIPVNVRLSQGAEAIKLTSAGTPPVSVQITEVEGGGFHLQMNICDVPALKLKDIRRETVRILLAERILRGHHTATPPKERLLLPDWIFTGTLQTLDFRSAERPATMFAAIFKSGKIYGIEEIITASPTEMDSLSRAIYDTSCGALLMALIDQPDGGKRFNKFLNTLAVNPKPERTLLDESFPGFAASTSSLNKWWSLQLASLAKRRVADPLSADETIKALEQALTIRYVSKKADVPKDIQKRPFDPVSTLFTAPPPKAKQPPPSLDESAPSLAGKSDEKKPSAKPSSSSKTDEDKEDDASISKKEGSPWLRYLTFGLMGSKKADMNSDDETSADTEKKKPEEKTIAKANMPPETKKDEPATSEEAPSSSFFGRLASRQSINAAAERQKVADDLVRAQKEKEDKAAEAKKKADEEKKTEKPTAEPKKETPAKAKNEPKPEDKERGSLINPLNWFRSGKKPVEEGKEAEKAKSEDKPKKPKEDAEDEKSALWIDLLPTPIALVNWHVSPLFDLWSHFSSEQPRHAFLDFLKRKKPKEDEEKAKKAAEPEKPKPAPAKKKEEPKAADKTPPKATNPNAKPAAKPVQPANGAQRTTNPAAKPVPLPKPPPATSTEGDDDLPTLPPDSQWVEIHLEDYQHILKHPDRAKILDKNAVALRALHQQASILMRPVINGYLSIVIDLQEGKTKDIDKRLKDLRNFVAITAQQTKAVRDYIDYYEANETEQLSGKFDDFLDLPNIIERELPTREDPIARYLDAIDKEFTK